MEDSLQILGIWKKIAAPGDTYPRLSLFTPTWTSENPFPLLQRIFPKLYKEDKLALLIG